MRTVNSETLSPDHELHMEGDSLYIDGVGAIAQHHSYYDQSWEKGLPYFVRDVYFDELFERRNASARDIQNSLCNLQTINSKICLYEMPHTRASPPKRQKASEIKPPPNVGASQEPPASSHQSAPPSEASQVVEEVVPKRKPAARNRKVKFESPP